MDTEQLPRHGNIQVKRAVHTESGSWRPEEQRSWERQPLTREGMLNLTGNTETLMHLIKGNLGTGIMALPFAVNKAGLWFGFGGIFVIAAVSIHCMHMLIACCHHYCHVLHQPTIDYGDIVYQSFVSGPRRMERAGRWARKLCNFFLCFTQLGANSVYFVFMANNIAQVVNAHSDAPLSLREYIVILLPFVVLYCYIKNLDTLAPLSSLANLIFAVGTVIVLYYTVQDLPATSSRPWFGSLGGLPVYFGTVIYSFEGIGMIIPLENKMRSPSAFPGLTGVLNTAMSLVAVAYGTVGFYGCLKYGAAAQGSLTLNVPLNLLTQVVRVLFSLAVLHGYALVFYVPVLILWPPVAAAVPSWRLLRKHPSIARAWDRWGEYVFRTALVLCTWSAAMVFGQDLGLFISLVGAGGSSALALLYPVVVHTLTFWDSQRPWTLLKNLAIFLVGIVGAVTGTYNSVAGIVEAYVDEFGPHGSGNGTAITTTSTPRFAGF